MITNSSLLMICIGLLTFSHAGQLTSIDIRSTPAVDYKVILLKGEIRIKKDGRLLKTNSRFSKKEKLQFNSSEAYLLVVDGQRSTFLLRPNKKLDAYATLPIQAKMDTRPGNILSYIAFRQYWKGSDFLVLGGSAGIELGTEEFPMDEDHFFYVQYRWEGSDDPINKKLSFRGNQLLFSKDELYQVDGQPIDPNEVSDHVLFYYDAQKETSLRINNFNIVFPNDDKLKMEIGVLVEAFGTLSSEEEKQDLRQKIENILFQAYGRPEESNLSAWLLEHFEL